MKQYLFDTNICIYIINKKPPEVFQKFKKVKLENIFVSSITAHELYYGIYKSKHVEQNLNALDEFLSFLSIISFEKPDSIISGKIRTQLEKEGNPIGPYDLLIASQAIQNKFTLVTNNIKEFKRIKVLDMENWIN